MIRCSNALLIKLSLLLSDRKVERVAVFIGKKVGSDYVVTDVLPARNEDLDPENKFFVSNRQLSRVMSRAQQKGCLVLGIAHSHPAHHPPLPSIADFNHTYYAVNAVYHPATRSLTWFNQRGELTQQLIHAALFFPKINRNYLHV